MMSGSCWPGGGVWHERHCTVYRTGYRRHTPDLPPALSSRFPAQSWGLSVDPRSTSQDILEDQLNDLEDDQDSWDDDVLGQGGDDDTLEVGTGEGGERMGGESRGCRGCGREGNCFVWVRRLGMHASRADCRHVFVPGTVYVCWCCWMLHMLHGVAGTTGQVAILDKTEELTSLVHESMRQQVHMYDKLSDRWAVGGSRQWGRGRGRP